MAQLRPVDGPVGLVRQDYRVPASYPLVMALKVLAAALTAFLLAIGAAAPTTAASDQIQDPALDQPAPSLDITSVGLSVAQSKGAQYLQVKFTMAGPIGPEAGTVLTGYSFQGTVGKCVLLVRYLAAPEGGVLIPGTTTRCGDAGRDVGGATKVEGNTLTMMAPLRDLKEVKPGAVMKDLTAFTSPGEGGYHDMGVPGYTAGDFASSDKPWTIG